MTIFYVYVQCSHVPRVAGHVLLTCGSRYIADELFRQLQAANDIDARPLFTSFERTTPQFWCLVARDTTQHPWSILMSAGSRHTSLARFKSSVIMKEIVPIFGSTLDWPIIPIVPGPDWLHNGLYFIRNQRRPDRYWHFSCGRLSVSNTKMTKFQICGASGGATVLIRSDSVSIRPLGLPVAHFLSADPGQNSVLIATPKRMQWGFGEFLGGFAETESGDVRKTSGGEGEDWELC